MEHTENLSTPFTDAMSAAAQKEALDASCKRVLSEKHILAWILHACVEEFHDVPVPEIAEVWIEGTPEVSVTGVMPERSHTTYIQGMPTEDTAITEGNVYYDIRFYALSPRSGEPVKLIINLEAQNKYHNSYALVTRAIYYLSRMISAQYGTEFSDSHYEDIKKVYSIWICMNPPKMRRNTITSYRIDEFPLVGSCREEKAHYDLLCAVMVCLGEEHAADNDTLRLLDLLFTKQVPLAQKKEILQQDYAIPISNTFAWEVEQMCNFSQGFFDRGLETGMEQGMEKGIAIGTEKGIAIGTEKGIAIGTETGILRSLRALITTSGISFERAAELLMIPHQEWESYKRLLASEAHTDRS